jgi:hypothetical protein
MAIMNREFVPIPAPNLASRLAEIDFNFACRTTFNLLLQTWYIDYSSKCIVAVAFQGIQPGGHKK